MHTNKKIERNFNLLIIGTGGQGQITLLQVLAEAALIEQIDFKSSELHGLSQRGGSVEVHIRMGKKVHSPMLSRGKADLILALEMQESLTAAQFASGKTKFLINKKIIPVVSQKDMTEKEILLQLKKITNNIFLVEASQICQKELAVSVLAGIYLISLASFNKAIPLKSQSILKAIKRVIPQRYLDLNIKAFQLAQKSKIKID